MAENLSANYKLPLYDGLIAFREEMLARELDIALWDNDKSFLIAPADAARARREINALDSAGFLFVR